MTGADKVLAIIPARSGSKGLAGKNIRDIAGKPLIGWSVEHACSISSIDEVLVTSDSSRILDIASSFGPVKTLIRPPELASDEASSVLVVEHVLKFYSGFDWFLLLQPTSPIRSKELTEQLIDDTRKAGRMSGLSVCELEKHPVNSFYLRENGLENIVEDGTPGQFVRRQDVSFAVSPNGSLYFANCDWFLSHRKFYDKQSMVLLMNKEFSIDIDDDFDFQVAEYFLKLFRR